MATKTKDALDTRPLHTFLAYERQKLSTSLTQHKAKAKHHAGLHALALASNTPAATAAVPGSHAPLSQRKRQLLTVRQ